MITNFGEKRNEPENNEPENESQRIIRKRTEVAENYGETMPDQPKKESTDLTDYKTQQIDIWPLLIACLIKVSKGQKKISLDKLTNDIAKIKTLINENN